MRKRAIVLAALLIPTLAAAVWATCGIEAICADITGASCGACTCSSVCGCSLATANSGCVACM